MTKPEVKKVAHDLSKQDELLMQAYKASDDCIIESAFIRVVTVRRMKKNSIFDWETSDAQTEAERAIGSASCCSEQLQDVKELT